MAVNSHGPLHSCQCLNVQIIPQPHQQGPPDFLSRSVSDSEYTLTYVADEGLSIAHPQVTMRTRKLGPPSSDTSRRFRYTTLSCLICRALVYRVTQLVPLDVEGQEGPLLPSHDWVEQETLKSISGWIEVHKDCLHAGAISEALSSVSYSPTFSIIVPPVTPVTAEEQERYIFVPSAEPSPPRHTVPAISFLSNLRPLFPPVPFIPSHPVFSHLSSVATGKSEALRIAAEEYLAKVVEDQLAEIERAEDKLRKDVEGLWKNFIDGIAQVEKARNLTIDGTSTRRRDSVSRASRPRVSLVLRDFIPASSPVPRALSPASVPRVSSLSASLATSAFYHPRAQNQPTSRVHSTSPPSPPPYSSNPSSSGSADSPPLTSSDSSSRSFSQINGENILQPFRRSMDEAKDVATSFRYFTNLEADMARVRQQNASDSEDKSAWTNDQANASQSGKMEQKNGGSASQAKEERYRKADPEPGQDSGSKGKRKVTFDVKPDVVTINGGNTAVNGEKKTEEPKQNGDSLDMIFDLEDEKSERGSFDFAAKPVLPLIEPPYIPARPPRTRVPSNSGLPVALSSLRPASLPAPSTIRSLTAEGQSSPRASNLMSLPRIAEPEPDEHSERFDSREEEILKLVAANTPSHRGAWKRNSKAWQVFVRRQGKNQSASGAFIPEENEDEGAFHNTIDTDDSDSDIYNDQGWNPNAGVPASLPITIGSLKHPRPPLSLASYQPKATLSDPSTLVPPLPGAGRSLSSSAFRKASYAERDRSRLMDPGALDFVAQGDEDEDESDSEDEPSKADAFEGGRGRQRAFKILQARSKIPAAGMWRSLA
ncbi:hypothetical protein SERLA73DRAFT_86323 [Serpula lacrymans var. lacrymans S7.3]|uniref:Uncharacterized protein n=1 Tax=Serpula lacrymans var. lacrymans (strain S7.3) TaxID=936435 RepID=F8PPW9_SERL3|nr:hypothetical protein SERLA73DRAFT_86323 [Serpula lacrymans var. lacrymans S7.3]